MFIIILLITCIAVLVALYARIIRRIEDEDLNLVEYDPSEYNRARLAYLQAQQNFELADSQYIDVAISDLGISENRVNNEIAKKRIEKAGQSARGGESK